MFNEFSNELMTRFSRIVDNATLEELYKELCVVSANYDISEKSTDIILWQERLPKCFEYFIVTKRIEGISDKTLDLYSMYIKDFLLTMRKSLEDLTPNDIRVYLYTVQQRRGLSNRTLNSRRAALNSFFSWISAEGYISKNPMITVRPIKFERKKRKVLKPIELERVRGACTTIREQAIIEVLYSSACRVSELVRLNRNDVDLNSYEIKLFGKGNKHRISYLSPKAAFLLQEYLSERTDTNEALFVSMRKPHQRITKAAIEKIVKQIGKRAGINNLFPHIMRHTSATNALSRGMSIVQLKELLGHTSLDVTNIYAKVSTEDVKISHQRYIV